MNLKELVYFFGGAMNIKELVYYGRTMNYKEFYILRQDYESQGVGILGRDYESKGASSPRPSGFAAMHSQTRQLLMENRSVYFRKIGHITQREFWYCTFVTVLLEYLVFSDNGIDILFVS